MSKLFLAPTLGGGVEWAVGCGFLGGRGRACDTFERDRGKASGQRVYEKADNELRGSRGRLSECTGLITRGSRSPNYMAFQIVLKDSVCCYVGVGGLRGLDMEGGRDEEHFMLPLRPSLDVLLRSGRRIFHNFQKKPQAMTEWVISYFGDVVGGPKATRRRPTRSETGYWVSNDCQGTCKMT